MRNPCLLPVIDFNASPTASQTDTQELEDISRLKKCFICVRRLEHEFPAEFVEKLWKSYEESLKRKTDDDDDDEYYDKEVSPPRATKTRSGRGRKLKNKSSLKRKSMKPKYCTSSESSSDNYTTDYDDSEEDEDYVPLGKRRARTNYRLRRRN